MSRKILAIIDNSGFKSCAVYLDRRLFYKDTFSPDHKVVYLMDFRTKGRNYSEKKASVLKKAAEFSANKRTLIDYSYSEIEYIYQYFKAAAKKYGLKKELKAAGIL